MLPHVTAITIVVCMCKGITTGHAAICLAQQLLSKAKSMTQVLPKLPPHHHQYQYKGDAGSAPD